MASWKKLIVSGGDANLANVVATTVSSSFSGSFQGNGSGLTNVSATIPANVVSSSLQFFTITSPFTGSFTGSFIGDGASIINIASASRATKLYIEPSASSNLTVNGITTTFRANESHVIGDAVYINSTGSAQLGNATNVSSSLAVGMCIASVSGSANGEYLLHGIARYDTWNWTVGGIIFLSKAGSSGNTMTQINSTGSNQVTQILGIATHADRMFFNPQLVQVITV
jgi:hypothetical protein